MPKRSNTPYCPRTVNIIPEKWIKWIEHCTPLYGGVSARTRQIIDSDLSGKPADGQALEMLERKMVELVLEDRKLLAYFNDKENNGKTTSKRFTALADTAESFGLADDLSNLSKVVPKLMDIEPQDFNYDGHPLSDDLPVFIRHLRCFKARLETKAAIKAELLKQSNVETQVIATSPAINEPAQGSSNPP